MRCAAPSGLGSGGAICGARWRNVCAGAARGVRCAAPSGLGSGGSAACWNASWRRRSLLTMTSYGSAIGSRQYRVGPAHGAAPPALAHCLPHVLPRRGARQGGESRERCPHALPRGDQRRPLARCWLPRSFAGSAQAELSTAAAQLFQISFLRHATCFYPPSCAPQASPHLPCSTRRQPRAPFNRTTLPTPSSAQTNWGQTS